MFYIIISEGDPKHFQKHEEELTENIQKEPPSDPKNNMEKQTPKKKDHPFGGIAKVRPSTVKGIDQDKQKNDHIYIRNSSISLKASRFMKIDVDEDFFSNYMLPSLWKVIISSIPIKHIPLLSLLFAFNIGLKKKTVNQQQYHLFFSLFISKEYFEDWKNSKQSKSDEKIPFNAETVSSMENKIAEFSQSGNFMFDEFFKIIKEKLQNASNLFNNLNL